MPSVESLLGPLRGLGLGLGLRASAQGRGLGPMTVIRTATKRAGGGRTNNKDSAGRRLGPKVLEGAPVRAGEIIFRQRGTKFYPGENASIGRDHTIFAKEPGYVRYYYDPFHPRRRFIGVALSLEDRLPTPHFEPRKRRFGYVPITNPKELEAEKTWLSRQAKKALEVHTAEMEARDSKRQQRLAAFAQELSDAGFSGDKDAAARQWLELDNYVRGGRTLAESRRLVDADRLLELRLAKERGELSEEELAAQTAAYQQLAADVDAVVMHAPNDTVVRKLSDDELAARKQEIVDKVKKITETKPVSPESFEEARQLLNVAWFSKDEARRTLVQHVRGGDPVVIPKKDKEALSKYEKLAKEGKGSIVPTYHADERCVYNVFLPVGTPKTAILM